MNESHQPLKKCSMPKENTSIEIKKETEFQSSKPYPPIDCSIKNSMYARICLLYTSNHLDLQKKKAVS